MFFSGNKVRAEGPTKISVFSEIDIGIKRDCSPFSGPCEQEMRLAGVRIGAKSSHQVAIAGDVGQRVPVIDNPRSGQQRCAVRELQQLDVLNCVCSIRAADRETAR